METSAQRSIRHCMAMLAPFEASVAEKCKGEKEFYDFIYSIYEEMYKNPEAWFVFPAPYEEYMKKAKERAVIPKKEKRACQRFAGEHAAQYLPTGNPILCHVFLQSWLAGGMRG